MLTTARAWCLAIGLVTAAAGGSANLPNDPPDPSRTPRLVNTCYYKQCETTCGVLRARPGAKSNEVG